MKKFFLTLISIFILSSPAWAGDYYIVGVDYFKKGDYNKAATNLEQSIRVSPNNVNARYYLAQVYLTQKRIPEATNQYNRIILLSPSSEAARLSQKGLSLINQNFAGSLNEKIASIDGLAQYKDNYLEYILSSGKLVRWAAFPLKVYVQPSQQQNITMQALGEWQKRTDKLVNFEYVNSAQAAQITIDFKPKLENTSTKESYVAGYSKPYYQGDHIVKSEIHILSVDPATGKDISSEALYFTVIHELGHSLGFKGHSPNKNDVMYSRATGVKTLSQRDINTLNLLYRLDKKTFAIRGKSQGDVQLQQAIEYVKTTPGKAAGWANLGDIYRDKKMYPDSIRNYQKAISLEPDKADLHNLLGYTYTLAGDKQNAFASLKTACDLDKTNTVYLYQFCLFCSQANKNQIGKEYLDAYLKANPGANSDEKIKSLKNKL